MWLWFCMWNMACCSISYLETFRIWIHCEITYVVDSYELPFYLMPNGQSLNLTRHSKRTSSFKSLWQNQTHNRYINSVVGTLKDNNQNRTIGTEDSVSLSLKNQYFFSVSTYCYQIFCLYCTKQCLVQYIPLKRIMSVMKKQLLSINFMGQSLEVLNCYPRIFLLSIYW